MALEGGPNTGANRFGGGIMGCGAISTGETLSTGGRAAHGDLTGGGAGNVFELEGRDGFSSGDLVFSAAAF
jgi:hypothetical protein